MKQHRRFQFLLLGLMICMLLSACSASQEEPQDNANPSPDSENSSAFIGFRNEEPSYDEIMQQLEAVYEETRERGVGDYEVYRVEGSVATFIQMNWGGSMGGTSTYLFVYREGGRRLIDLEVFFAPTDRGLGPDLEDTYFSEDGETFYCSVELKYPDVTYMGEPVRVETYPFYAYEEGMYDISIDVETGEYQRELQ